jgi:cell division septal protein FtsQ
MWYNPYKLLFMKKNTRENQVNEKIVRIVAAQVVLFTILLLLTNWKILALFLVDTIPKSV